MSSSGINFDVVINLINRYGSSVTITPVTKTISNIEGDESLVSGVPYKETVYFSHRKVDWMFDEASLLEGGDAIMLVEPTSEVSKDDVITYNNSDYRIQDVINRTQAGGEVMFKSCNLFLIKNDE